MSIKLQVPLSGANKVPNFEEDRKQMLVKVERGFRYQGKTQRREVSVQDYMAVVKYISKRWSILCPTAEDVYQIFDDLKCSGGRSGKGCKPTTLRSYGLICDLWYRVMTGNKEGLDVALPSIPQRDIKRLSRADAEKLLRKRWRPSWAHTKGHISQFAAMSR